VLILVSTVVKELVTRKKLEGEYNNLKIAPPYGFILPIVVFLMKRNFANPRTKVVKFTCISQHCDNSLDGLASKEILRILKKVPKLKYG
jgi:hypothetical protein